MPPECLQSPYLKRPVVGGSPFLRCRTVQVCKCSECLTGSGSHIPPLADLTCSLSAVLGGGGVGWIPGSTPCSGRCGQEHPPISALCTWGQGQKSITCMLGVWGGGSLYTPTHIQKAQNPHQFFVEPCPTHTHTPTIIPQAASACATLRLLAFRSPSPATGTSQRERGAKMRLPYGVGGSLSMHGAHLCLLVNHSSPASCCFPFNPLQATNAVQVP